MTSPLPENSTYINFIGLEDEQNESFFLSRGFGVLMLFLIIVMISAFMCITLKKDTGYLWPLEGSTQDDDLEANGKRMFSENESDNSCENDVK